MSGSLFKKHPAWGLAMDTVDRDLLAVLEKGLPVTHEPFGTIGRLVGIPEAEVISRIEHLRTTGMIRRFKARIDQRKAGIAANALVAWKIPEGRFDNAGDLLARSPSVTHVYERRPVPGRWDYTHYTVHHGRNCRDVTEEVQALSESTGLPDYLIMFSTEEFKRVPTVRICENGSGAL